MNADSLLALISDLYAQAVQSQTEIAELRAELDGLKASPGDAPPPPKPE